MKPIKQGICWGIICRGDITPERAIVEAKRIGIQAFDFAPAEEWQRIKDAGLELSLVVGHASLRDGLNKRENHDRIFDELMANIDNAAKFGIHNLCCLSGDRYFNLSELAGVEICAEILARVAPFAEEKGVMLTTELLNSRVDHPGYQCDSTEWGVHLCKLVDSPNVKLLYDIYHMQIMEGDLIRTIRNNIGYIAHFHTAGNPGRNDLDDQQEIYYPAIARAIAALDYDGFVTHEFGPKGDNLAAIQQAYEAWNV
ncbi:MAG: TIM barrel protein [Armatimonadota bacterium]